MAVVHTAAVDLYPHCLDRQLAHITLSKMDLLEAQLLVAEKPVNVREAWEDVLISLLLKDEMNFIRTIFRTACIPEAAFRGDVDF
jgi:hypothetical protein